MRDHYYSLMKKRFVTLIVVVGVAATAICLSACGQGEGGSSGAGQGGASGTGPEQTGIETTEQAKSLREFCGDAELDAWFDSIEENTPVSMTFIEYGEAPIAMDFTDRELILKAVAALQTVEIDGLSEENPDYVSDAGGVGYYFDMEDGTTRSFSFMMGCFQWKQGEWHDVAGFGDLPAVDEKLDRIGNPKLVYVYAEDGGFYTEALETFGTEWQPEDGFGGGLFIYAGEAGTAPYVQICRCASDADAEAFVSGELDEYMRSAIAESGAALVETGQVEPYTVGRTEMPSVLYTAELPSEQGGGRICYLNVVREERDDQLGVPCLVRFCAVYREADDADAGAAGGSAGGSEDSAEKSEMMNVLRVAIKEFCFKYMAYEKKDVQPGNYLLDFINDDRIRAWFEGIENNMPDQLIYTTDSWETIDDPEKVERAINALQTVKIGGVSSKHVGASGRRIYDFMYVDSGEDISFEFYEDTFYWDGESYDIEDWGELK